MRIVERKVYLEKLENLKDTPDISELIREHFAVFNAKAQRHCEMTATPLRFLRFYEAKLTKFLAICYKDCMKRNPFIIPGYVDAKHFCDWEMEPRILYSDWENIFL